MEQENRLSKILSWAGVASRRHCETLITSGAVTVNGSVCTIPQTRVSLEKDTIRVNDIPVESSEKKVYYILNKPKGTICSNKRVGTKKLVIDLFTHLPFRIYTVGRLDRDTTGLLILTNDGNFAHEVIHPSANLTKEYLVKTKEEIEERHLKAIGQGGVIENVMVRPVRVRKVRKGTIKIAVKEGKKREVRRLCEKAGLTILQLHRIRIGGLELGDLPVGSYVEMSEKQKKLIFS